MIVRCTILSIAFVALCVSMIFCNDTYKFMPNDCTGGLQIGMILVGVLGLINLIHYLIKKRIRQNELYEALV